MTERDISYGELAELGNIFDEQCEQNNVIWDDEEVKHECLIDFIIQYQNGDDEPQIRLLDYGYHLQTILA